MSVILTEDLYMKQRNDLMSNGRARSTDEFLLLIPLEIYRLFIFTRLDIVDIVYTLPLVNKCLGYITNKIGISSLRLPCNWRTKKLTALINKISAQYSSIATLSLPATQINNTLLASLVNKNNSLQSIDVSGCNITNEGVEILQKLPNLTILNLGGADVTNDILDFLPNSLVSLNLGGTNVSSVGMQKILTEQKGKFKKLRSLNLEGCKPISDEAMLILTKISILRELNVAWTCITDDGFTKQFAKKTRLRSLELKGCMILTDACLSHLPPSLVRLNLYKTYITDEGIKILHEKLPNLTYLNVSTCVKITNGCIQFLPPRIQVLNIADCTQINGLGVKHLPLTLQKLIVNYRQILFQAEISLPKFSYDGFELTFV
eukprot:TRINITY_DN1077_c0_g1_i1.p1 TRINITY_DN1077_c0_g1~~TRINITY_DN1077_c0_g1_i1.p1  ORF type:complete len:375 (-),score=43.14 TRINITY_DN1077_c0_g1_i1:816-1940(-)